MKINKIKGRLQWANSILEKYICGIINSKKKEKKNRIDVRPVYKKEGNILYQKK